MLFEYPSLLSRFCFLPVSMYYCWWTSCPRGYLSGSNFIWPDYALRMSLGTFSILFFYHYSCTTAGGQVVPEGTCRVVILYDRTMLFEYRMVLSRFCFFALPMYHCWWTSCPRGYLSGSILYDRTMLFEYPSVLSRFWFLTIPMFHCWWTSYPRGYLSGSNFIWPDYALRISLGTLSILLFTTTHVPLLVDKLSPRVLVG